ncbi:hypothetical protein [Aquipseudomonas alcaligenes]|uniref:Uncharacterized protein n=1 Tax=Aquipseudomonas alcaligenes TaxID=43263 RepID=A0A1N6S701_AQUAC|nr:hypothetical protein [Pseudomonas alcaligenes]SIQ36874.1 hypothetical protein SAMN05878282_103399 [Pseudomonas alcaligenes]
MSFFSRRKSPIEISEAVQNALLHPFIPEFSDYVQKIRRNCIAISSIILVMVYGKVTISSDLSTNGFKLVGLDDALVKFILLLLSIYWFIHFLWCAIDYFAEWQIRLTSVSASPYTFDGMGEDVAEGRDNTLVRWMIFNHQPAIRFSKELTSIRDLLNKSDLSDEEKMRISGAIESGIQAIQNSAQADPRTIKTIEQKLTRFERRWSFFKNSQSLRWLIVELITPLGLGALAIYELASIVLHPYLASIYQ